MIWDIVKAFFEAGMSSVREVREAKKRELEIRKLEDEEKERKRVIEKVSTDDVQKYDPKQAALHRSIEEGAKITKVTIHYCSSQLLFVFALIVVAAIVYLGFWLFRCHAWRPEKPSIHLCDQQTHLPCRLRRHCHRSYHRNRKLERTRSYKSPALLCMFPHRQ